MSGMTAVIVFDPLARAVHRLDENSDSQESLPSISPEDAEADAKLLYYYPCDSTRVEDRRNQSNLIQGVLEFAKYCRNDPKTANTDIFEISTSQLFILVKQYSPTSSVHICIVFGASIKKSMAVNLLNKFISYYELLHGPLTQQLDAGYSLADTFDDYVPCYIGAEGGTVPQGIRYAPVDRHCIVATHSLGLEMLYEFSEFISEFAIMYKGHLISSSLAPESLVNLYSYLVLCSRTGTVSNTKLLNPPYGRISTPAISPGGGSSAFGRSNFFDLQNSSDGFLFGPTGVGESVFAPGVWINGKMKKLVAYLVNGLMLCCLTETTAVYAQIARIKKFIDENHEVDEIFALVRSDFAKYNSAQRVAPQGLDYMYMNHVNKSLVISDKPEKSSTRSYSVGNLLGSRLIAPFSAQAKINNSPTPQIVPLPDSIMADPVTQSISELVHMHPDISNVSVKPSSSEGWRIFTRRGDRSIMFEFKDPKVPLWKVSTEVDGFVNNNFESIYV